MNCESERLKKGELPLSAQSAFCAIPTTRSSPKQFTYFNNDKNTKKISTYDRIFNYKKDYNEHLHRCDREHARGKGLKMNEEVTKKRNVQKKQQKTICRKELRLFQLFLLVYMVIGLIVL